MVRYGIFSLTQNLTIIFTFSAPLLCPNQGGFPCSLAHRRFPSIMTARCLILRNDFPSAVAFSLKGYFVNFLLIKAIEMRRSPANRMKEIIFFDIVSFLFFRLPHQIVL